MKRLILHSSTLMNKRIILLVQELYDGPLVLNDKYKNVLYGKKINVSPFSSTMSLQRQFTSRNAELFSIFHVQCHSRKVESGMK